MAPAWQSVLASTDAPKASVSVVTKCFIRVLFCSVQYYENSQSLIMKRVCLDTISDARATKKVKTLSGELWCVENVVKEELDLDAAFDMPGSAPDSTEFYAIGSSARRRHITR